MTRTQALCVVFGFGLAGLAVAFWGLTDIRQASQGMMECAPKVAVDNSAFYFLGLAVLPLFALLPVVKERLHTVLLAAIVGIAILLPGLGFQSLVSTATDQNYEFQPELTMFGLQTFEGNAGAACQSAT